ncbi:hypothetical protein [Ruminococcus flavefaciens]|uniref:hypothetical protein n=1 Tax=Ruminococcus flavefaciens TaxID=1265 RepID=UPI0026EB209E|nr:hypothetical protein [Ruminococcus flavefaciens]
MEHHNLDAYPLPKESKPLFINEPWLIDKSLQWIQQIEYDPAPLPDSDNIRVYIPMDISKSSILRRLDEVIGHYGAAMEANEMDYAYDVVNLIAQIEIYDQIWFIRHMPKQGKHSLEAIELVKEFVKKLEDIEEGDSEMFPYNTIDILKKEFIETVRDQNEPMVYEGDWY